MILPYILKTIWCMNNIIWDYESVWPKLWPQNKYRSLWPIFQGPVACLISWRLFDVCTSYFGSMNQYDQTFDLKINVGHCDLYSLVQWFCLISWRLFDVWTLLLGYELVWPKVLPQNKYRSLWPQWPIFYGLVILCYILRTIWCMNIILWD